VTGTVNLLIAARDVGARRFVYSASSSAYGDTPVMPKREDMRPLPLSPYAVSKLAAEYYCTCWSHVYKLQTIALRYFNVFGPRQDPFGAYAAVIPAFVSRMLKGERPVIYGDGEQSRDFCYIENVVNANMLAAAAKETHGEVVNVACGDRTTLLQIVADINKLLGTSIQPEHKPPRAGDVRHSLAAIDEAKRVMGYEPKVFFAEGLRRSIDWYKANL
jgi:UDP-glucose 4-epimerase